MFADMNDVSVNLSATVFSFLFYQRQYVVMFHKYTEFPSKQHDSLCKTSVWCKYPHMNIQPMLLYVPCT